jgi:hypothetical protein
MMGVSVREKAIKLRKESPSMTLKAIADECGVSGERVRQILLSERLETRHLDISTKYYCSRCGKRIFDPYSRNNGTKIFRQLCVDCSYEWHHVKVTCSVCGKIFETKTSVLLTRLSKSKSGNIICSIACRNKAKSKYDHLFELLAEENANGTSMRRSLFNHGIPVGYQGTVTKRMLKLGYKLCSRLVGPTK